MKLSIPVSQELNKVRELEVEGVTLRGLAGPSEFPHSVSVEVSEDSTSMTLKFLYYMVPEEPTIRLQAQGPTGEDLPMVFHVGKMSGRIMCIKIHGISTQPGQRVSVEVDIDVSDIQAQLRSMAQKATKSSRRSLGRVLHYQALAEDLVPAMMPDIERRLSQLRLEQS